MVRLAQLVRASDCGSEGRGFETHISPPLFYPECIRHTFGIIFFISDLFVLRGLSIGGIIAYVIHLHYLCLFRTGFVETQVDGKVGIGIFTLIKLTVGRALNQAREGHIYSVPECVAILFGRIGVDARDMPAILR